MHQSDLNRAVADATGETVTTIKRLGFLLADPDLELDPHDEDLGPRLEFELRALLLPHAVEDPKHLAFDVLGEELRDGGFVDDGDLGASA